MAAYEVKTFFFGFSNNFFFGLSMNFCTEILLLFSFAIFKVQVNALQEESTAIFWSFDNQG